MKSWALHGSGTWRIRTVTRNPRPSDISMHYHLIGICGAAMASLAGMLQARGHRVTGSDENVYPPMSTMLEALGVPVRQGYRPEHLTPAPDCVVIGNALSRGNAEVEETLNRRLVYRSQAEVVKEEFIRGRRSLVVAGTHGKTTTTSIATWVLERGGLNPSFLVGGVVQNFGTSFRVTDRSEEHTSELQSHVNLVCRLLLEKKK